MKIVGYVRSSCRGASIEGQLKALMEWKALTEQQVRSLRARASAMRPCPSCGAPNGHRKIECRGVE